MRLWPWQRTEHRASATDALVQAILGAAQGNTTGDWRAIAALETAVSLYASAMAVSTVICENAIVTAALTPSFLATLARALIRRGEFVAILEASPARGLELLTAGSWDVRGGPAERDWWYRVDLFGPSGSVSRTVPSAQVLHVRYAVDPARAWRGLSPLDWANSTGALAGHLEHRLGELSACGVPVSLATDADGTAQRESWRRFVHGPVSALGAIVGAELGQKLNTPVGFTFSDLYASDLVGRSSALARLVKATMPLDEARAVCGL